MAFLDYSPLPVVRQVADVIIRMIERRTDRNVAQGLLKVVLVGAILMATVCSGLWEL
ncbi:hypothetical protein N8913_04080 [Litoricola sp.]|nr:hypothetical protein [Litorivicinus sp.]